MGLNAFFKKTTPSNDKTKVSSTAKQARQIFATADQNHGLGPFKICNFFDYSKMSFLWSKNPLFEKTTSSDEKTKVSCSEMQAPKIFGIFDQNHALTPLEIRKFFNLSKMTFLSFKKLCFQKTSLRTKPRSFLQKSRLEKYLKLIKIIC